MTQQLSSETSRPTKVVLSSLAGTVIEWYEFFIYGTAAALVFNKLFFPTFDPLTGRLLSLSTFAVAFIARPVGAAIFGHFGDRVGRKALLVVSLTMMGGATFAMGLLPSYGTIGVLAPILLVLLRVIQGISLGGEYGGAVLMTVEHADPKRRGLLGGLINTGASCGLILATLAFYAVSRLPESSFMAWGWRIPFLLSSVLLVLGIVIRLKLAESPEFRAVQTEGRVQRMPLGIVLSRHTGLVVLMALSYLPSGALFYLAAVFSLSYGTATLGMPRSTLLLMVCLVNVLAIGGISYGGWLSDRFPRRRVYLIGLLGTAVTPWLWFMMFNTAQVPIMFAGYIVLFIPFCVVYGIIPAFFSHVFPPQIRYSGMALGYSIGTVLGSGLSPIIATSLLGRQNNWIAVAAFIGSMGVVAFLATLRLRELPATAPQEPVSGSSPIAQ